MIHLIQVVIAFMVTWICYQPGQAAANYFTAMPVKSGDTLISILRQHGFNEHERDQILSTSTHLQKLFLTLDIKYMLHQDRNLTELRVYDSQTAAAFRILKHNGKITATPYKPNFKITLVRIEGRVHGSVLGSILAKIDSNFVASRFNDAYAFDIRSAKAIKSGAPYWFTVQKKYDLGAFVKYGEILQTSLDINGQIIKKHFVRTANGSVFFNKSSLSEKKPFYAPVNYLKIASNFQPHRIHPITGRRQPHLGIDFELPSGDPVFAPRQGIVMRYGFSNAAGNYIVLAHSNGMETAYNHLSKINKKIRRGYRVYPGDQIAEVGCTGYCTRAHLHFAIKYKGQMINPINYIKSYPYRMEQQLVARVALN
jgi:murein DD-endopeptidase MepM/ murein hydrolase activator NlpD